jgi:hypothetical protein
MNTQTTYRKTKTGTWVAYGPAADIRPGHEVTISKKDGTTKTELVESVGRSFRVDGREMVYGYLTPKSAPVRARRIEVDHEDCLSMRGGCGPRCPYSFVA